MWKLFDPLTWILVLSIGSTGNHTHRDSAHARQIRRWAAVGQLTHRGRYCRPFAEQRFQLFAFRPAVVGFLPVCCLDFVLCRQRLMVDFAHSIFDFFAPHFGVSFCSCGGFCCLFIKLLFTFITKRDGGMANWCDISIWDGHKANDCVWK